MDEKLRRRYLKLFNSYRVAGRPLVASVKSRLSMMIDRGKGMQATWPLRADAALVLLTLADTMIIRPYFGSSMSANVWFGEIAPPDAVRRDSSDYALRTLNESLDTILGNLRKEPDDSAYSSHDAMQAIERSWPKLSKTFGWG
jgi:hypothetical protein